MILFKRPLLRLVLEGKKTQTRRTHNRELTVGRTYPIAMDYYHVAGWVRITGKHRQRLGEISPEDVAAEGFQTLNEFVRTWVEINGEWNPDQVVTVYEFTLV